MIAYKMFHKIKNSLYPWNNPHPWTAYSKTLINTRANGCGPFACFKYLSELKEFAFGFDSAPNPHKVKIKLSKDIYLWDENGASMLSDELPAGTILADEFEILERVK